MTDSFCAANAVTRGESMVGTGIDGVRFLVCLEFQRAWPKKILSGADLAEPVVRQLAALDQRDDTRVQYLRRADREVGSVVLLVADMRAATVRRWNLGSHQAMTAVDWSALDRGVLPGGGQPVTQPVVLVCTHGKRDACCAKWGVPFWRALLARESGSRVQMWQTSHLGGHRFAATALVLPHGFHYGRLEPDEAEAFVEALAAGRVYDVDKLRGRAAWSRPAQAAEIFSRQGRALRAEDVVVAAVDAMDVGEQGGWRVALDVLGQRETWHIVRHVDPGVVRPPSCGKVAEPLGRFLVLA